MLSCIVTPNNTLPFVTLVDFESLEKLVPATPSSLASPGIISHKWPHILRLGYTMLKGQDRVLQQFRRRRDGRAFEVSDLNAADAICGEFQQLEERMKRGGETLEK